MLVNKDSIPIGIKHGEARGSRLSLVSFGDELDPLLSQLSLQLSNIGKAIQWLCILVPTGVERKDITFEHALKESDRVSTVSKDKPVLFLSYLWFTRSRRKTQPVPSTRQEFE